MLDLRAVAARLFVSPRKIWRLVASGEFPKPVKVGSSSRWFEPEVAAYQQKLRNSR
jgi:predicted DNA-binding transcriptional regulator AlpA